MYPCSRLILFPQSPLVLLVSFGQQNYLDTRSRSLDIAPVFRNQTLTCQTLYIPDPVHSRGIQPGATTIFDRNKSGVYAGAPSAL